MRCSEALEAQGERERAYAARVDGRVVHERFREPEALELVVDIFPREGSAAGAAAALTSAM